MGDRRLRGEGSIYQRESDGRWVGVIDLGWVGGKRVRKTVTARTLKDLRPKFNALKRQIQDGILTDDATVQQWMKHWVDQVASKKVRPSTLRTYETYIDRWIVPHLGKHRLDRLRPDHIRTLYSLMEAEGKSDATRRQVHAILRRALVVAENDGRIGSNPAAKVDAPSVGQGSHGKFTLAEAKKILAVLKAMDGDPIARARWTVALLAGLRQGEALGLVASDVDFELGVIRVRRAAQRIRGQGIQLVEPKSASAIRDVPMVAPVQAALEAIRDKEGYLFGSDAPCDPRRDWANWRALLATSEAPMRPLHAARATTASLLSEAGVPDKIIAEILGHSQVVITQKHYVHGDYEVHRRAMKQMGELFG